MAVWMYGCMAVWLYGYMAVELYGWGVKLVLINKLKIRILGIKKNIEPQNTKCRMSKECTHMRIVRINNFNKML